LLVFRFWWFNQ